MGKKQLVFTQKDKRLFQALAKTGRTTHDLSAQYYNVKYQRLERFVKEGFLKKEPTTYQGKATYCYRLTDKGKNWVKQNIHTVEKLYKPSTQGTSHDVELFKKFAELNPYEQDIAMTESDITSHFGKMDGTSPPDLYVPKYQIQREDGTIETVETKIIEITTKTYTQKDIQAKEKYVQQILKKPKGVIVYEKAI